MSRRRAILGRAILLCAALAGGAASARAAEPQPTALAAGAQDREILVMLRLSADHYRPDAAYGGDYGGGLAGSARRHAAQRIARRNRLEIVQDGWPMPLLGIDCFVMRVPAGMAIDEAVAQVSHDPQVAWSQPMQTYRAQGAVAQRTDPLLAAQPAATLWHLSDLHRIATGKGVTVAVVDSRVDVRHPDLAGQFVADRDFTTGHEAGPERHGTGVAGVIAAKAGNGLGIAGIAPAARLMALRACWQTGDDTIAAPTVCDTLSLAQAIQFAILHNAGVINLSLSGPADPLLGRLIGIATARRIAVVAAYDPALPRGGFPASTPGVIAVANESLALLPPGVYAAPGQDIPTTQPGGKWFLVNGSSYAAAHVSGLMALVRENRAASPRATLVAVSPAGGAIDACATLLRSSRPCDCACGGAARVAASGL